MNFKEASSFQRLKKLFDKVHLTKVEVNNGAHDYCNKSESRVDGPWSFGEKPVQRNSKADWD